MYFPLKSVAFLFLLSVYSRLFDFLICQVGRESRVYQMRSRRLGLDTQDMFVASRICKAFKSFGAFSVHLFEFNKKEKLAYLMRLT